MKFNNLPDALDALAAGKFDAVVNSVGALQYLISKRYAGTEEMPQGLLAPAYMAIALPEHSPLKRPIDEALVKITSDPEWMSFEQRFFSK
jgi:ABC-type amino acid transport substrate-binding protein